MYREKLDKCDNMRLSKHRQGTPAPSSIIQNFKVCLRTCLPTLQLHIQSGRKYVALGRLPYLFQTVLDLKKYPSTATNRFGVYIDFFLKKIDFPNLRATCFGYDYVVTSIFIECYKFSASNCFWTVTTSINQFISRNRSICKWYPWHWDIGNVGDSFISQCLQIGRHIVSYSSGMIW